MNQIKFALAAALVAGFAATAAADSADHTVGNFDTVTPQRMWQFPDARAQYLGGRAYRDDLIIETPSFEQWWFERGSDVPNG